MEQKQKRKFDLYKKKGFLTTTIQKSYKIWIPKEKETTTWKHQGSIKQASMFIIKFPLSMMHFGGFCKENFCKFVWSITTFQKWHHTTWEDCWHVRMHEIHIEKGVEKNLHSKLELKDVQHLCVPCCASEERIKRESEREPGGRWGGGGGVSWSRMQQRRWRNLLCWVKRDRD